MRTQPGPRPSGPAPASTDRRQRPRSRNAERRIDGPAVVPVQFLEKLRPGGPWVLTAIVPDGPTTTITARTAKEVEAFVCNHDGKRNLYYMVNPARRTLGKKGAKTDVDAIEFSLGDLDPAEGESAEDAKARYLKALETFKPKPTALIDSGNGLQCLWRLEQRIELGEPVKVQKKKKTKQGKEQLVTEWKAASEDQAIIDDVEARIAAIMERLGAKAGTQNIDRILRLPGTTNLPNAKKRKDGRVPCQTKLLWFDNTSHPLSAFPPPAKGAKTKDAKTKDKKTADAAEDLDLLNDVIQNGRYDRFKNDRSSAVWYVVNELLRRGYNAATIKKVLLDEDNAISEHVYDRKEPEEYADKQIEHAIKAIKFIRNDDDKILHIAVNVRIALVKLGVSVAYDEFADRTLIDGLAGFSPALDDAAVHRLWLQCQERLGFRPELEFMRIVISDMARINSFHPVREYLDGLTWDGTPRVDTWLINYAGAEDTPSVQAVSALKLVAAVRRVRKPGCKFDETLVLEQPVQGNDKSTALRELAVREEWFSDDLPLNVEGKRVIEMLRGHWIIEAAELSGMKKADVEHMKALLSRRVDRARMAWGRLPIEVPRQCVVFGTTNKRQYLRDTTGNRRFWPVRIEVFDVEALKRDRDQLWAEAAAREAKGESIRLAKELWPVATREQEQRLADDPYVAVLAKELDGKNGKIRAADVWVILDLRGAQLTQEQYQRSAEAMKRIGFERPNKAGTARFNNGTLQAAFVRGATPKERRQTIEVTRDREGLFINVDGGPLEVKTVQRFDLNAHRETRE